MEYHVTWEIDLDADSPEHAARLAAEMLADPVSTATIFTVQADDDDPGLLVDVDLL